MERASKITRVDVCLLFRGYRCRGELQHLLLALGGEVKKPSMGFEYEGAYCTEVGAVLRCLARIVDRIVERDCGGFRVRQFEARGNGVKRSRITLSVPMRSNVGLSEQVLVGILGGGGRERKLS